MQFLFLIPHSLQCLYFAKPANMCEIQHMFVIWIDLLYEPAKLSVVQPRSTNEIHCRISFKPRALPHKDSW